jgi:hypothetical protein
LRLWVHQSFYITLTVEFAACLLVFFFATV